MNYEQAVEYINSFLVFGSKLGLERIENLLQLLGNPQDKLKFIHVAGTNGKGSTCCYISSMLKSAGYKTGMFISPYIVDFRERFQINGKMIEKDTLAKITLMVKKIVDTLPESEIPTEFELITAIGFLYFAKMNCDVVVLEVGLGGRYDSTNVIKNPLVSVICSISLDHTAILGDTVEKIAFEKGGIIKKDGKTVLYPKQQNGVVKVISDICNEQNSQLIIPDKTKIRVVDTSIKGDIMVYEGNRITIPILGEHQAMNALTAIAAVKASGLSVCTNSIINGIEQAKFPARCEILRQNPTVILDGAHNPDGVTSLKKVVENYLDKPIGIIGMMKDKDIESVMKILAPLFSTIYTVTVDNPRTITAIELSEIISKYNKNVVVSDTIEKAISVAKASNNDYCVCGSFYLCGEAEKYLKN